MIVWNNEIKELENLTNHQKTFVLIVSFIIKSFSGGNDKVL